jgi:transposase
MNAMPEKQDSDFITLKLGLPELRVLGQWTQSDGIHVLVEKKELVIGWCLRCDRQVLAGPSAEVRYRTAQDLPLYDRPVFLHLRVRRRRCDQCQGWVSDQFASVRPFARQTRRLHQALKEEARGGRTVTEVAASYGVGYHAAYDAAFKHAGRGRKRALPEQLGIDEFAKRKGHNYDTILLDLAAHRTVDVIEGRTKKQLVEYLKSRPEAERQRVKAVCTDLSETYAEAVREALPRAELVADRFHVMQLAVKAVDKERRAIQRELPKGEKDPLFKTRYLLTKPAKKLNEKQQALRDTIRETYETLDEAASFVEALREWYQREYKYLGAARTSLETIIKQAAASDSAALNTLAKTLTQWKEPIVAYMRHRITNGPTEGTNNKVKTIKRAAYGHRKRLNLRTRILAQTQ